jgi:hypothetical protein
MTVLQTERLTLRPLVAADAELYAAGDVNGDGFADLVVGAWLGDDGGGDAGEAYVVFGKASGFGSTVSGRSVVDLSNLAPASGFIVRGDIRRHGRPQRLVGGRRQRRRLRRPDRRRAGRRRRRQLCRRGLCGVRQGVGVRTRSTAAAARRTT